jgi:hypothetical protein
MSAGGGTKQLTRKMLASLSKIVAGGVSQADMLVDDCEIEEDEAVKQTLTNIFATIRKVIGEDNYIAVAKMPSEIKQPVEP